MAEEPIFQQLSVDDFYREKQRRIDTPSPYDFYIDTSEQDAAKAEEERLSTKASVNDARQRKREGKLLTYPLDMKSNATDYLEIRVINYKRNGFLNSPGSY